MLLLTFARGTVVSMLACMCLSNDRLCIERALIGFYKSEDPEPDSTCLLKIVLLVVNIAEGF
jgi:hypothetical protein